MGKCKLCGSDGLLYDTDGVLCRERCQRSFLEATEQYMTDGYIVFLLADGTVSNGDLIYESVTELKQKHQVTFYRVNIQ